jgi:hypothetical protein
MARKRAIAPRRAAKPVGKTRRSPTRKLGPLRPSDLVLLRPYRIDWWKLLFPRRCLNYNRQDQQQTNWCWAAVSGAVAAYYNASTTWTQCAIADAELGRSDCCGAGASGACNVPWYLNSALSRVGHLASFASGTLTFAIVQSEINAGRPVCARIGWSGGGGHFVALTCWYRNLLTGTQSVRVDDPWPAYGRSVWLFSAFSTAYQGSGSWTHSYRTA